LPIELFPYYLKEEEAAFKLILTDPHEAMPIDKKQFR
jgi:hypothetical protein